MHRQPNRLSQKNLRRNGGNSIFYVLISFNSRDVFFSLTLKLAIFLFRGLSFVLCSNRFAVHNFSLYSVLGSFVKEQFNDNSNEYNGCVILCSVVFRCVQKVTKQQSQKATFCIFDIWRLIFIFYFLEFWCRLTYSLGYFCQHRHANWMSLNSREIQRLNFKSFFNRRCLWRFAVTL